MGSRQIHRNARTLLCRMLALVLLRTGFVKSQVKKLRSRNLISLPFFHNPSRELFAGCAKWLIDNGFVFISVQELYDILSRRTVPPAGTVCLTVDDGWRENLTNIIPVIDAWRIPICIFVSTGPVQDGVFWWSICSHAQREGFDKSISVDRFKAIPESERSRRILEIREKFDIAREAMTEVEVVRLSTNRLVTIGSHTVNHACLNRCTHEELHYEIVESKRLLSDWIQRELFWFSYPNGDFKGGEGRVLAESGYLLGFGAEQRFLSPSQCECDRFYLPRFSLNDRGSVEENICKMIGLWQTLKNGVNGFRKAKRGM